MKVKTLLYYFVIFIPVLNAVADVTVHYFKDIGESGFHLGLIRGALLVMVHILFTIRLLPNMRISWILLLFLIYLLAISLLSSSLQVTFFTGYLKWFSALLLFPLGYITIKTEAQLLTLLKSFLVAGLIILVNLLVAQYTQYGMSTYVEGSFYTGGAGVGIANDLAFICLLIPLFFLYRGYFKRKGLTVIAIAFFVFLLLILLSMKRAAILGFTLGFLVYFITAPRRTRVIKGILVFLILFVVFMPLFDTLLTVRVNARLNKMTEMEDEARYKDVVNVIQEFSEGTLSHKLFGSEMFNSQQFYGPKYFGRNRMIHGDFTSFFYGGGVTALLLYLMLLYELMIFGLKRSQISINRIAVKELYSVYLAVLACAILISFTGSGSLGSLSLPFLSMGALASIIDIEVKKTNMLKYNKVDKSN
jgi:hypothetical protein